MTRNSYLYLTTEAILAAAGGLILPVYVLYFRYFEVSLFEVAALAAAFEATILICELPTGIFADRYGRKKAVIIGFALFAVGGAVIMGHREFTGFFIGEILLGAGEAFISGSAEALAVDSYNNEQRSKQLPQLFSWRSRIRIAVSAIAMLIATSIYQAQIEFTFFPILAGGVLGTIVACFFSRMTGEAVAPLHSIKAQLTSVFGQFNAVPIIKVVLLLSIVTAFTTEGVDQFWQVLGAEVRTFSVGYFGIVTAAGAVLAFTLVGPVVRRSSANLSLPILLMLLAGTAVSSLPLIDIRLFPVLLVIYFAVRELLRPIFSVIVNDAIASEGRATFLSGYNLTMSLGEVIGGVVLGGFAMAAGLHVLFVLCGVLLVLVALVSLALAGNLR